MRPLRNVIGALWIAVRSVRVWLTSWVLFTVPAVFVVLPSWQADDAALSRHPGASSLLVLPVEKMLS